MWAKNKNLAKKQAQFEKDIAVGTQLRCTQMQQQERNLLLKHHPLIDPNITSCEETSLENQDGFVMLDNSPLPVPPTSKPQPKTTAPMTFDAQYYSDMLGNFCKALPECLRMNQNLSIPNAFLMGAASGVMSGVVAGLGKKLLFRYKGYVESANERQIVASGYKELATAAHDKPKRRYSI